MKLSVVAMTSQEETTLENLITEAKSSEAGLLPAELVIALSQSRALAKEERYQEAITGMRLTLRNAYERKALDRSNKGEWDEAKEWFLKAAEHADGDAEETLMKNVAICYLNLGLRYEKDGQLPQAYEAFVKATAFHKNYAKAYYAQAKLLARSIDAGLSEWQILSSEAIAALRQTIAIDPSYRAVARRDTDFDSIRNQQEFLSL